MAYHANPFLERMSERTADQEFVDFFSPKILEKLHEDCLQGAVHIFRSPPGGGKTTILRAFTPNALRAFWHARPTQTESYRQLVVRGVIDENTGPQLLGVFLSCAAGYSDLPPGTSSADEGAFRALLDCRIVLRTLRSLGDFLGNSSPSMLNETRLEYDERARDLTAIPLKETLGEMVEWAEKRERAVYGNLDALTASDDSTNLTQLRFEGVLWLQYVRFHFNGKIVAPNRLLMIDDIQKLRKSQRLLLIDELISLRPKLPVWLAGRNIAFLDEFLSQGVRDGRDVRDYSLEEMWGASKGANQFVPFAQNILDRRFMRQSAVPGNSFSQYLVDSLSQREIDDTYPKARSIFQKEAERHHSNIRYADWLNRANNTPENLNADALFELYVTRILIARDLTKKQLTFELAPLSTDELEDRESGSVKAAAEIFANYELKLPYYFGLDRLCSMATNNVEELLSLAAALYDGMKAKQVLGRQQRELSPAEQEKRLRDAAMGKISFVPRGHTQGSQARKLLDSIGVFCRDRTFLINAPYAPGVTGVRLANGEMEKLKKIAKGGAGPVATLARVLFECVAENLLVTRPSNPSTSREGGTVLYLNRTLCAHYGLPLGYGGWQETTVQRLLDWMENGFQPQRKHGLEVER